MNPTDYLKAFAPKSPAPSVAAPLGGQTLSIARAAGFTSAIRAPVAPASASVPVPPSAQFPDMPIRAIRAEPSSAPSKVLLFGGIGLVAVAAIAVVVLKKKRG